MKLTKLFSFVLTVVMVAALLGGCTASNSQANIVALKGPTGMGMAWLMDGNGTGSYNITLANAPDEITGQFANGDVDIAAVPINMAAALYNKTDGGAVIIAVNTLGVLYVLESGNEIQSISDLSGKTLYATGQASTPEYVIERILQKNNITDCTIEYKTEHSELATLMASGEVTLGMLPEPNVTAVTSKNANVRVAIDLTEEWNKVEDTQLVQGCIIVRKTFLEEHKDAVNTFLKDYAVSVDKVNNDTENVSKLIEKYEIMASAALAQKAIPNCNIVCITGTDMAESAKNMLTVLFEANPKSVGGKLPADDFYYIDE